MNDVLELVPLIRWYLIINFIFFGFMFLALVVYLFILAKNYLNHKRWTRQMHSDLNDLFNKKHK